VIEEVYRREWGRVVGTLVALTGDWDLAEECAQDAFAAALEVWPRDGEPSRPGAWLTTVARNRALDRLRRERVGAAKLRLLTEPEPDLSLGVFRDDRLKLVFTCCHPALAFEAQVTLALRTVCGLSVPELARAFQTGQAAMAKRLTRTKRKITTAGIPYRVPPLDLLPARTAAVLGVVYLLFNEGYAATSGPSLIRRDLCEHAIHLARIVHELMPQDAEAGGLLALLLLLHARSAGRVTGGGEPVPLEEQDPSTWDSVLIAQGLALLRHTVGREVVGPYQLQALIAACHSSPVRDRGRIAGLYDELEKLVPSPAVRLNRAIAHAMAYGPAVGLELLDRIGDEHQLYPAARGDLLRRLGRRPEAVAWYERALDRTANEAERAYLRRRLDECRPGGGAAK
jgi:RNA polymerase sigma-70 factor (ECF subfamily)